MYSFACLSVMRNAATTTTIATKKFAFNVSQKAKPLLNLIRGIELSRFHFPYYSTYLILISQAFFVRKSSWSISEQ